MKERRWDELVAYVKSHFKQFPPPHGLRLHAPDTGASRDLLVLELEFESLTEFEDIGSKAGHNPDFRLDLEKMRDNKSDSHRECWRMMELE